EVDPSRATRKLLRPPPRAPISEAMAPERSVLEGLARRRSIPLPALLELGLVGAVRNTSLTPLASVVDAPPPTRELQVTGPSATRCRAWPMGTAKAGLPEEKRGR